MVEATNLGRMGEQAEQVDPWPLRHLVLRTPRLELRPDDDEGARELAGLARRGIHPQERMPFAHPWTDAPEHELGRNTMQHLWRHRAELCAEEWTLCLLVRVDGEVVGMQDVRASRFARTREISSGSWLGTRFQGRGIGTEMRAAILMFAFDRLDALQARSTSFPDNEASLAVSRKLGYVDDGTEMATPRGQRVTARRLLLTRERFAEFRPDFNLEVKGLDECLPLLGLG